MFRERTEAIKSKTAGGLIGIPLLITVVMMIAIPALTVYLTGLVLPAKEGELVTLSGAIAGVFNVILSALIILKVSKIKLKDIGLGLKGMMSGSLVGIITGTAVLAIVALITAALGGVEIAYVLKPEYMTGLLVGVLFFAFQGTFEELVFRAYLMPHFAKKNRDSRRYSYK